MESAQFAQGGARTLALVRRFSSDREGETMLSEVLQMTVVRTEGCHLCDDAESLLRDATADGAVNLEVVTADSTRGWALVAEHRPAVFPLVLADGRFFCAGRLPRGKFARLLAQRTGHRVTVG